MAVQRQVRHVGDTLSAIAVTCKRPNGDVVSLASKTVEFKMVNAEDGTVKVAATSTGVSVTGAADGQVQYNPVAADVNTAGTYYGYFLVYSGTDYETFPVATGDLIIQISPDENVP